jgi:hypothetical protein
MLVLTRQSTYLPAVLCYRAQMVVERALPSLLHLFRTSGGPSQQLPTPLLYSGGENFVGTRSYGAQRAADSDRSQACLAKCRLALFNQVQQERMSHMSIGSPASAAKVSRVRWWHGGDEGALHLQVAGSLTAHETLCQGPDSTSAAYALHTAGI